MTIFDNDLPPADFTVGDITTKTTNADPVVVTHWNPVTAGYWNAYNSGLSAVSYTHLTLPTTPYV